MLPGCSDHSPILLNIEVTRLKVIRPFMLLSMVMHLQEYKTIVPAWRQHVQGYTMYSIWRKLKLLELHSRGLHQEHSSIKKKLYQLRESLKEVQDKPNDDHFNVQLIEEERNTLGLIEK